MEPITYVRIDAHKADLQVALLAPETTASVTWTVRHESGLWSGCGGVWNALPQVLSRAAMRPAHAVMRAHGDLDRPQTACPQASTGIDVDDRFTKVWGIFR